MVTFADLLAVASTPGTGHQPAPLNCPKCGRFLARCGSRAVPNPNHIDNDENWGECKVHGWQEWLS